MKESNSRADESNPTTDAVPSSSPTRGPNHGELPCLYYLLAFHAHASIYRVGNSVGATPISPHTNPQIDTAIWKCIIWVLPKKRTSLLISYSRTMGWSISVKTVYHRTLVKVTHCMQSCITYEVEVMFFSESRFALFLHDDQLDLAESNAAE